MKSKRFLFLLKILALLLPFYLVYYAPLHQYPEDPDLRSLWTYVLLGFAGYLLGSILLFSL
jgi:hypothetical protein